MLDFLKNHSFAVAAHFEKSVVLTFATEITETTYGRKIALGLAIFWLARLITQFFGYSSELWKGKTFETTVHVLFTFLWVYLSGVFGWIALG